MAAITQPQRQPAPNPLRALGGFFNQETILLLSLIALALVVGASNERFLRERNLFDILSGNAYIAVAAIGMSMVIISGNIDISVGSLIGVLATLSGQIAIGAEAGGYPLWLAFIVPLFGGALAGAVNGFFVAYLRIPAIVVTLGMMSILKGGLIIATGGEWIYNLPPGYELAQMRFPVEPLALFGGASISPIPLPIYVMVILTVLAALWMRYSPFGRAIYAVGGNREAARLSGLSERRVIMGVFIINGVMVGISSVLFATQFNAIQSTVPPGVELTIITATVVGGVSILGGTGTVIGAMLAAILLRTITSAMVFLRVSDYWIQAVQGALILLTVLADLLRRRRQAAAR